MNSKDLIIIGYGGVAKEVARYIDDINYLTQQWDLLGYCAEEQWLVGRRIGGYDIIMTDDDLKFNETLLYAIIGSGLPQVIKKISNSLLSQENLIFPNIVHPQSYIATSLKDNCGNIIAPGAVVSVGVEIGYHNLINYNCTIGHDAIIGNYNVFNPSCNVSGNTEIGSGVLVGAGAQVLQGLSICDNVVIGAGAVVTKNIFAPGVYTGIPARKMNK